MKRVVAALIVIAFAGCSFLAVNGPDIPPGTMPPLGVPIDCTDSRVAPVVDIVLGGLFLLAGIGALIEASSGSGGPHAGQAALGIIPAGIVFAISAVVGFDRVSECNRVRELYMR